MTAPAAPAAPAEPIEAFLRPLFWDCDPAQLDWTRHETYLIERILRHGTWEQVTWLRTRLGDPGLAAWLRDRRGKGLTKQQLRFWQLLLDLDPAQVDDWIADRAGLPWEGRVG